MIILIFFRIMYLAVPLEFPLAFFPCGLCLEEEVLVAQNQILCNWIHYCASFYCKPNESELINHHSARDQESGSSKTGLFHQIR